MGLDREAASINFVQCLEFDFDPDFDFDLFRLAPPQIRALAHSRTRSESRMNRAVQTPPLSLSTKLFFGLGQTAEGIKSGAFNIFLFFYFNQVLGLSGTLAGLALLIAVV
jgi:hypothetical protein